MIPFKITNTQLIILIALVVLLTIGALLCMPRINSRVDEVNPQYSAKQHDFIYENTETGEEYTITRNTLAP